VRSRSMCFTFYMFHVLCAFTFYVFHVLCVSRSTCFTFYVFHVLCVSRSMCFTLYVFHVLNVQTSIFTYNALCVCLLLLYIFKSVANICIQL